MAASDDTSTILSRIESVLVSQAAAVETRFLQGDANVMNVMTILEARLAASEDKLANAMTAVQGTVD